MKELDELLARLIKREEKLQQLIMEIQELQEKAFKQKKLVAP